MLSHPPTSCMWGRGAAHWALRSALQLLVSNTQEGQKPQGCLGLKPWIHT